MLEHYSPLLALAVTAGYAAQLGSPWQPQPVLPMGVAGMAATSFNNTIVVAGGTQWEGDNKLTLAKRWQLTNSGWQRQPALPHAFAYGAYGVWEGQLVLAGGIDDSDVRADVLLCDIAGRLRLLAKLPAPRAYCGGTVLGGNLYVLGGTSDIHDLTKLRDTFWCIDLAMGEIVHLPDFPGGRVMHAALAATLSYIFVFPGGKYDDDKRQTQNAQVVWRYSPLLKQWETIAPYPFPVRGLAVCALDERHVLTVGGYKTAPEANEPPAFTTDCFIYDAVENRYRHLPPFPYAAMQMGLLRHGDLIYAIGGEDRARHRANAVYHARIADLIKATFD
jgi:N-acetylneuraminic acid mutarotase